MQVGYPNLDSFLITQYATLFIINLNIAKF